MQKAKPCARGLASRGAAFSVDVARCLHERFGLQSLANIVMNSTTIWRGGKSILLKRKTDRQSAVMNTITFIVTKSRQALQPLQPVFWPAVDGPVRPHPCDG